MLNLTPANFVNSPKINLNQAFGNNKIKNQTCEKDVFVKSSKINFCGSQNNNSFLKWAEETNFNKEKIIGTISSPQNQLGSGFSNNVYLIPENDDYVLRFGKNFIGPSLDLSECEIDIENSEDENLSKINVGQQIAAINLKFPKPYRNFTIEVLKRQEGTPNGVVPNSIVYDESGNVRRGQKSIENDETRRKYADSIEKVANMPVESYKKMFEKIAVAKEGGYRFDFYNPQNFLIDSENQSINPIDLEKGPSGHKSDWGNILYALVSYEYLSTFTSSHENGLSREEKNNTLGNVVKIIENYTTAMKETGLKFDKKSYYFNNLFDDILFSFFLKESERQQKWLKLDEMGLLYSE